MTESAAPRQVGDNYTVTGRAHGCPEISRVFTGRRRPIQFVMLAAAMPPIFGWVRGEARQRGQPCSPLPTGASERFRKWGEGYKFVRTLYNLVVKVVRLKF